MHSGWFLTDFQQNHETFRFAVIQQRTAAYAA
jgi:hypothetical protein